MVPILILLGLSIAAHSQSATVTGTTDDGFVYNSGTTQVTIVQYVGAGGDVAIPGTINVTGTSLPVTEIGASAFSGCNSVTSVAIPASVSRIGDGAFCGCAGLVSFTVDVWNFYFCSVDGILLDYYKTTIIQYPGGKPEDYFWNALIWNKTYPTIIGKRAFYGCTQFNRMEIPGAVASIGDSAFEGCTGLTSVVIPSSVTSIGVNAFAGCTGLTSMTFPCDITYLCAGVINSCKSITDIAIYWNMWRNPDAIWSSSFKDCSGIKTVTIGDGVTGIGSSAFSGCSSLTSVSIPFTVDSIGVDAFHGCGALTSITVDSRNDYYTSLDGVLIKLGGTLLQYPCGRPDSSYTVPSWIDSIGDRAFQGCSQLTSVIIPAGVTQIGNGVFDGCGGLKLAYCLGNAPAMGTSVFANTASDFTVEYFNGGTGFSSPTWTVSSGDQYPAFNGGIQYGSVQATIAPEAAVSAGADWWQVDGGPWNHKGAVVGNMAVGKHTVAFQPVKGWGTPPSQEVSVAFHQTAVVTGTYVAGISIEQPANTPLVTKSGTVSFGAAVVGCSTPLAFTVRNTGTVGLSKLAMSITGSNAAEFQPVGFGAKSLAPGKSTTCLVRYSPRTSGTHAALLRVTSTDPALPAFDINLAGTAVSLAGYAGSFTGVSIGGHGFVNFTLTSNGNFTSKLLLYGRPYTLKGTFDSNGDFSQTVGKPPILVNLHIDPSQNDASPADLTLNGSADVYWFTAYHGVYAKGQPVAEAGYYTTLLRPDPSVYYSPQGTGYATMKVGDAGAVTIAGKLADNASFSFSGLLVGGGTNGNRLLVFVPAMYSGDGSLIGTLNFQPGVDSDCEGTLAWRRPWQVGLGHFNFGFNTNLALTGARYTPPVSGQGALPISTGTVALSWGSLDHPIAESVTLLPSNAVSVDGANSEKLKFSIKPATGLFSGSFVHPATNKPVKFNGALYQNPNAPGAGGYFLGPSLSGTVWGGAVSLGR